MHKFKNLDGLRGLAAVVVVLCHYANSFLPSIQGWSDATRHTRYDKLISTTPLHLPLAGDFAVYVFFVLSGFVLSYKFFTSRSVDVVISSAARRYLRLMIPALGSVLLAYILLRSNLIFSHQTAITTGSTDWLGVFWTFPAQIGAAVYNGVYGSIISGVRSYNVVLWTMQLELFGSFLIFMIMALFGSINKRWYFYLAFGIILLKTSYLAFLLGMALSDAWINVPEFKKLTERKVAIALLVIGLFFGAWYIPLVSSWTNVYSHLSLPSFSADQLAILSHTIGAFFIIIAILQLKWLTRFFELRIMQFLGRISFSLYLLHLIILASCASFIFNHLIGRIGYGSAFLVAFSLSLTLTLVIAHYYTEYVDSYAISFSKKVGDYLLSNRRQNIIAQAKDIAIENRELIPAPEAVTIPIE